MFEKIDIYNMQLKTFDIIGNEWMLVTAGNLKEHNTMTASWGGLGILWHKPVATIYIRPQRYTKKFIDAENFFTISFYNKQYKKALEICGTESGRDVNKDEKTGLTAKEFGNGIAFSQAYLVLVCEKLYANPLNFDGILQKNILGTFYKDEDYHYVYIGGIVDAYENKNNR